MATPEGSTKNAPVERTVDTRRLQWLVSYADSNVSPAELVNKYLGEEPTELRVQSSCGLASSTQLLVSALGGTKFN